MRDRFSIWVMTSVLLALLAAVQVAAAEEWKLAGASGGPRDIMLVSPITNAVVSLVNDDLRAYFAKPRGERERLFTNVTYRTEMARWATVDKPVKLRWLWCGHYNPMLTVKVFDGCGREVFRGETAAPEIDVPNLEIGRTYRWTVEGDPALRAGVAEGVFRTADDAPRALRFPHVYNLRDLGGRIGLGGRRVKQGLVYRSGGLNDNAITFDRPESEWKLGRVRQSPEETAAFLAFTKIRTDLDLRNERECFGMTGSPLGPSVRWIEASSWAYGELGEEKGKVAFARAFRPFLDKSNYPIDFHCITGADRTGTVAFILNALLGVGLEDLYRDWEATALYSTRMDFYHARRLDRFVAVVNSYPGETLADKTAAFVKDCGFTDADIAFLREFLLEADSSGQGERASVSVAIQSGEHWWGGASGLGMEMPFTAETERTIDLTRSNYNNPYASMLISDKGRCLWCDDPTVISFRAGVITMRSDGAAPVLFESGGTLRDARLAVQRTHFPPSGRAPDPLFFSAPQYNTWIELTYGQNQRDVLAYARSMLDNGLPPGILMIDDTWQLDYGVWQFDPRRFPDPRAMCDELHRMGFKVMLWVCPWVSMDSPVYREIVRSGGGFYLDADGAPHVSTWWNGRSALLDFTHPDAGRWFRRELDRLAGDYGIDGFKFDGGELAHYVAAPRPHDSLRSAADCTRAYGLFARDCPFGEYRNAWRLAGEPIVVRLFDKPHDWLALRSVVADMMAANLIGYSFVCPDMVGGGSWSSFRPGAPFDAELFVRSAQVQALCGQMQFSASPWRILTDPHHREIIRSVVALRQRFAPRFVALASACGRTGEPMVRSLEYAYPRCGYAGIRDQFFVGDDLMVAPQLEKGATVRAVAVPPGKWTADDGSTVVGPRTVTVFTPLERLPYFTRSSEQ